MRGAARRLRLVGWLGAGALLGACACGTPNAAPAFTVGPHASALDVASGAQVGLQAAAEDAEGDALTFRWTQEPASPAGAFRPATAANTRWTAPAVPGERTFTLRLTVTDAEGALLVGTTAVRVSPTSAANAAPVLTAGPTATPSLARGEEPVLLSASATDAEGDVLTYAWEQLAPPTPQGTFGDAGASETSWTAPAEDVPGPVLLRVTVSDGRGGSTSAELLLEVARP